MQFVNNKSYVKKKIMDVVKLFYHLISPVGLVVVRTASKGQYPRLEERGDTIRDKL